jgi:hypothetical protein
MTENVLGFTHRQSAFRLDLGKAEFLAQELIHTLALNNKYQQATQTK